MLLLGVIVTLGVVCSSYFISRLFIKMERDHELTVKGYAEKQVKSDRGAFTVQVDTKDAELKNAYIRLNNHVEKVLFMIKSFGFDDTEVKAGNTVTTSVYRKNEKGIITDDFLYYSLTQSIRISSSKVELIEKNYRNLNRLIAQGIELQVSQPEYFIADLSKCKLELIAAATENGRARAEAIAGNSGGKIDKLLSARQGVFQITAPESTEVTDCGIYNTESFVKAAKIVVTLDYRLK